MRFHVCILAGRTWKRQHGVTNGEKLFCPQNFPQDKDEGRKTANYRRRQVTRGLAMLTVRARPPMSLPFKPSIAFWASSAEAMVTKPKPRGRLVMRSIIRLVSVTVPNCANASWRSFSVVLKERFPTNNLLLM